MEHDEPVCEFRQKCLFQSKEQINVKVEQSYLCACLRLSNDLFDALRKALTLTIKKKKKD